MGREASLLLREASLTSQGTVTRKGWDGLGWTRVDKRSILRHVDTDSKPVQRVYYYLFIPKAW